MDWIYRGRCWKFGDNVGIDGDMAPLELAISRETRPEVLRTHFMTGLDPDFPAKVQVRDIIVAGKRFAQGNPHIQGLLAARAHGVGLVVESIQRGSFRNAINAGVPILPRCEGVTALVQTGDLLEVDFEQGRFKNLSSGIERTFPALPPMLQRIIALGGWKEALKLRLQDQADHVKGGPSTPG
jgi:3-isopropylmalate/(R)-2-methylmalate dehydratase small subunit